MNRKFLFVLTTILALCVICASLSPAGTMAEGSRLSAAVFRIGGADRYETSALTAEQGWSSADSVVLASATNYADALAGVPLAHALRAPILLVSGSKLSPKVAESIERLSPENIYILGGEAAVSRDIENELASYASADIDGGDVSGDASGDAVGGDTSGDAAGGDVSGDAVSGSDLPAGRRIIRLAGEDRFSTGMRIAAELSKLSGAPQRIFAVCAYNYPDALAGGPVAAIMGCPMIYVDDNADLSQIGRFAGSCGCTSVTILGGEKAVSAQTEERLRALGLTDIERVSGADRYQTALRTAIRYDSLFTGNMACIATGEAFPDALSGGALAAELMSPLVLVNNSTSVSGLYDYLNERLPGRIYVLGGKAAVSDYAMECLRNNTVMTPPPTTTTKSNKGNAAYVLSPDYRSKYYIVVFEGSQTTAVYGKDKNGKYSVPVRVMKCSTGRVGRATPKGLYSVEVKYRWRLMVGDVYAQYACRFHGNYLFHSVVYNRKNDASSLDMDSYRALGTRASHGCVRLCVRDAKWIYDNVPKGTQVRVVSAKGPAATVSLPALKSGSKYKGWDPTDPLSSNPYRG